LKSLFDAIDDNNNKNVLRSRIVHVTLLIFYCFAEKHPKSLDYPKKYICRWQYQKFGITGNA